MASLCIEASSFAFVCVSRQRVSDVAETGRLLMVECLLVCD